jgi:hypothetical protein
VIIVDIKDLDITRNIRTIEGLKCDVLEQVSKLYKELSNGGGQEKYEIISRIIANLIITQYLLSKRIGIEYEDIKKEILNIIEHDITSENDIEKHYGDLSKLRQHIIKDNEG